MKDQDKVRLVLGSIAASAIICNYLVLENKKKLARRLQVKQAEKSALSMLVVRMAFGNTDAALDQYNVDMKFMDIVKKNNIK